MKIFSLHWIIWALSGLLFFAAFPDVQGSPEKLAQAIERLQPQEPGSGEIASLNAIAEQCVYPGGIGVIYARQLVTHLTGESHSWFDDCQPEKSDARLAMAVVKKQTDKPALRLYPNPAKGQVMVDNAPEGTRVEIYDVKGTKVRETIIGRTQSQISLTDLRTGIYLFRFINGTETLGTQKVQLID